MRRKTEVKPDCWSTSGKPQGPHTHTHTLPWRQACNSLVHRVRRGLVTWGIPYFLLTWQLDLSTCSARRQRTHVDKVCVCERVLLFTWAYPSSFGGYTLTGLTDAKLIYVYKNLKPPHPSHSLSLSPLFTPSVSHLSGRGGSWAVPLTGSPCSSLCGHFRELLWGSSALWGNFQW